MLYNRLVVLFQHLLEVSGEELLEIVSRGLLPPTHAGAMLEVLIGGDNNDELEDDGTKNNWTSITETKARQHYRVESVFSSVFNFIFFIIFSTVFYLNFNDCASL